MAKPAPILTAETDKAHVIAQAVLCALAGVSVFGVVWAVGHGSSKRPSIPSAATVSEPVVATVATVNVPSLQKTIPAALETLPPASLGLNTFTAPILPPPAPVPSAGMNTFSNATVIAPSVPAVPPKPSPSSLAAPRVPSSRQLKNPQVIESLEVARHLRMQGDTSTALESLRAADLREPNHPEILGEMALTYDAMGLKAKADIAWRSVLAMGESAAGGYYVLAKAKIEGHQREAVSPVSQSVVSLGPCQVIKDPAVVNGERVTVRLSILAASGAVIDPTQMDIHVFLFEQINDGERIEQVRAEAPMQNWVTAPVDWKDPNGESIDVTYDLPPPKPEEVRDLGKRSFYGFMVKLFYQNKLVGEQAQPSSLLEFTNQRAAPAGMDNSLFPQ